MAAAAGVSGATGVDGASGVSSWRRKFAMSFCVELGDNGRSLVGLAEVAADVAGVADAVDGADGALLGAGLAGVEVDVTSGTANSGIQLPRHYGSRPPAPVVW